MRKYDVLEQNRHYFWNQQTKMSRNKYSSYIQKSMINLTVIPKFDVKSFLTLIYDNQFLSATLQNASKPTREVIGLSAG